MSACIRCDSIDTELTPGDDGHFYKHCDDCGYVSGPFTSSYRHSDSRSGTESSEGTTSTLDNF